MIPNGPKNVESPGWKALRLMHCVWLLICLATVGFFSSEAQAGYTHYYTWKKPPDEAALKNCVAEMNRVIEARKNILVSPDVPESKPGVLKLGSTSVDFNGIGEAAHEPFVFPYVLPEREAFNFCKTAYKPYDEVVTACLMVARDHFPPAVLEIASDGSWADWSAGARLYSSVLGRTARNPMVGRGFASASAKEIRLNLVVSFVIFLVIALAFFLWRKNAGRHSAAWRRSFE